MCLLSLETSRKRIGYKVLALLNGKYHSSFTGQELTIGKVPKPPIHCMPLTNYWNGAIQDIPLHACPFHTNRFEGYTSAFIYRSDALQLLSKMSHYHLLNVTMSDNIRLVVVKIKFKSKTVRKAFYQGNKNIIAGKEIESISIN